MRLIGTISRGEMRKDALKFQAGQFSNTLHQLYYLVNLLGAYAEPPHAGINFDMHRNRFSEREGRTRSGLGGL